MVADILNNRIDLDSVDVARSKPQSMIYIIP
jgi:hypothetical protein